MIIQKNKKRLLLICLIWWLMWTCIQTLLLYFIFGFDWLVSITDATINNALLGVVSYALIIASRFYQPKIQYQFVSAILLVLMMLYIFLLIMNQIYTDETVYNDFLRTSLPVRAAFNWLMILFISAISWMWFYIAEQQEADKRKLTIEKLAKEAELVSLRQQLQPHFLFNSLNSISALAGSKPEQARTMIQQLSDFLRSTIRKDDEQFVLFSEELNHLQLYLSIEMVRFGHRLKVNIQHDDNSLMQRLPPLLLQPVVENAIKFGLYDTREETAITLEAQSVNNNLRIVVTNPFDPTTSMPRQGTGFGLSAIQRRLYLLYGRNDLLTTQSKDRTFSTQLFIPQS